MKTSIIFAALCLLAPVLSQAAFAGQPTTPSALWSAFQADPDAFRQAHAERSITISAVVADTHISRYLTPVVSLVDKIQDEVRVICVLPRADTHKLSDFKKGDRIMITGNFRAAREERIVIKQCQAQ